MSSRLTKKNLSRLVHSAKQIPLSYKDMYTLALPLRRGWIATTWRTREAVTPDEDSEDDQVIAETAQTNERSVLADLKAAPARGVEIRTMTSAIARAATLTALTSKAPPVIYQAAVHSGPFTAMPTIQMVSQTEISRTMERLFVPEPRLDFF